MKKTVFLMLFCCSYLPMSGQTNPQYAFYGDYDLSFLNQNAKNDADEIERTEMVLMLAKFFGLSDKHLVDLYYRVYQLEHTSVIKYNTINNSPLNFQCVDSLDKGFLVDFGTSLISNNKKESDCYNLRFASPVLKIAPELFSESVTSIKLPFTDSLTYISSPNINVGNLHRIEGKDVVDNSALVSSDGTLVVAAVMGKDSYTIPVVVKRIGAGAFQGCSLKELVIPETVTAIGENALAKCSQMTSLTIKSEEACQISDTCFDEETLAHLTLYVPKKNIKKYKRMLPSIKKIKAI